jgi:hypothetical protein
MNAFQREKTINEIRQDLWESYQPFLSQPSVQKKILDILKIEGKVLLTDGVLNGTITFETMIMSEDYFLSFFDLWLLVQKYQLPTVFMGTYKLLETNQTSKVLVGYKDPETMQMAISEVVSGSFFIVTQPITKKTPVNKPPIQRLILTNKNQLLIHFNQLNKESDLYNELKASWDQPKTISEFLERFPK